jgi:hypothetical protein
MAKNISIDRTKRLREEPGKGHNRWHRDIPPVIEVEPGEEVTLETRDAMDLQIGPRTTVKKPSTRAPSRHAGELKLFSAFPGASDGKPGHFLDRKLALVRNCYVEFLPPPRANIPIRTASVDIETDRGCPLWGWDIGRTRISIAGPGSAMAGGFGVQYFSPRRGCPTNGFGAVVHLEPLVV